MGSCCTLWPQVEVERLRVEVAELRDENAAASSGSARDHKAIHAQKQLVGLPPPPPPPPPPPALFAFQYQFVTLVCKGPGVKCRDPIRRVVA